MAEKIMRRGQVESEGFLKMVLWVIFFLIAIGLIVTWVYKLID